ncbi:MAG: tyrosine-type recombinase/integrase [Candidatus Lokiarchaeia archaeon]
MGTVFRKNGKWYINYIFRGERYRKMVGRSKRKALEALRKIEGDIISNRFNLPVKQKMNFRELAEYWLENYSKSNNAPSQYQKNRERINKHLVTFFGKRDINHLTPKLIDEYIKSRHGVIKPSTINRTLAILRKMFNDAMRWGFMVENPMRFIRKLQEPEGGFDYYKEDEVKLFLQNCSEDFYPIACCAVYTGMRIGEIIGLKWQDVDLERRLIRVGRSSGGNTKNRKVRYIPIHSRLLKVLHECRENRKNDLVFPDKGGKMRSRDFRVEMRKASRKAELRKIRVHDLRHTFASNYISKGGNILSLQKMLGHSSINMTLRYAHLAPDFMARDIELLNFDLEPSLIRPLEEVAK